MKHMNLSILQAVILVNTFFFTSQAISSCRSTLPVVQITLPAVVSVPRDAANGTLLATGTATYQMICLVENGDIDPTKGFWQYYLNGSNADYGAGAQSDTRKSGYNGVDIWWEHCNDKAYPSQCGVKTREPLNNTGSNRQQAQTMTATLTDEFRLIKSGPMVSGPWAGTTIRHNLQLSYDDPNKEKGPLYDIIVSPVTFNVLACSVRNSPVLVNMKNVSRLAFSGGIGSTTAANAFFIDLVCDDQTPVNVILESPPEGLADPSQGVINLTSSSSARGIGIQVKYKDTPVTFDSMFYFDTVQGAGATRIPFTANYYRTGTVQPGSANGVINFTMRYQ